VTSAKGWPEGLRLLRFESLDSTNEEARRLAAAGDSGPVWITAPEQTKGRGRRGNVWISDTGNLFATLLIRAPHATAAQLGFAASLAAADAVASYAGKVAGILLEAIGRETLAVGIGINLLHHPEATETPAISVNSATGHSVNLEDALHKLATQFAAWYALWESQGFSGLKPHWLKRASGLGGPIRARLATGEINGVFEDLDHDGALLLRTDADLIRITAAEVFLPSADPVHQGAR